MIDIANSYLRRIAEDLNGIRQTLKNLDNHCAVLERRDADDDNGRQRDSDVQGQVVQTKAVGQSAWQEKLWCIRSGTTRGTIEKVWGPFNSQGEAWEWFQQRNDFEDKDAYVACRFIHID